MDAAARRITEAAEAADGAAPLDEAMLIAVHDGLTEPHVRDGGLWCVRDRELALVVEPSARGRGVGDRLLGEALAAHPETLTAWSHGDHPAAARLAASHGFARVRDLWVMRRPATDPLPPAAEGEGVTIRSFDEGDADEVVRVNAAAFAHHPEQGAMDRAAFDRRRAEPWWDPAGLLVADTGTGLAGFHWTKQHSPGLGEVYVVGVDPARQGGGLGKALTLAGLHHLAHLGVDEVVLYVESDNAPAIAVYSGLGFTHAAVDTHVMYRRPSG